MSGLLEGKGGPPLRISAHSAATAGIVIGNNDLLMIARARSINTVRVINNTPNFSRSPHITRKD